MTAAVSPKVITWLTNAPQVNTWPLPDRLPPVTPPPPPSPISGWRNEVVNAVTRAVNAAPITTATASSTTFPRSRKSLNPLTTPLSTRAPLGRGGDGGQPPDHGRPSVT